MSPSTSSTDRADPDIDAGEIVQALMLRGWRRTAARIAPAWTPDPDAVPADPDTVRARAAQARAGLARPTTTPAKEADQ